MAEQTALRNKEQVRTWLERVIMSDDGPQQVAMHKDTEEEVFYLAWTRKEVQAALQGLRWAAAVGGAFTLEQQLCAQLEELLNPQPINALEEVEQRR